MRATSGKWPGFLCTLSWQQASNHVPHIDRAMVCVIDVGYAGVCCLPFVGLCVCVLLIRYGLPYLRG